MLPPRAIVFDLDNTLLDGAGLPAALARTCETVAARHVDLDAHDLLLANGEVWRAYWPEVEKAWTLGALSGAAVTEEAWRRTLRACACHDEALVRFARAAHLRYTRLAYRTFDDVDPVVQFLGTRVPLALITNGAADTQREKLHAVALDAAFETIAISGELGSAKPAVAIFHFVLDQLGVAAEDAWYVGDSLVTDIAGAKAAGLVAGWLDRRRIQRQPTDPLPDFEITTLTELVPLLGDVD